MILQGLAAASGIAIGPAFQFFRKKRSVSRETIGNPAAEWERFKFSLDEAQTQLKAVYQQALAEVGEEHAAIFEAQCLILEDPDLLGGIQNLIVEQSINAEAAVYEMADQYCKQLEALESEYFRERAADIMDVANRLNRILSGEKEDQVASPAVPSIVVAEDLAPSDTIALDKNVVLGFCTVKGGLTSHVAILARELGLPACVALDAGVLNIQNGVEIILDGDHGQLLIQPDEETKNQYIVRLESRQRKNLLAREHSQHEARTRDGHHVHIVANISNLDGALTAIQYGAEGVGLFRTELLYLEHSTLPDEESQLNTYRAILQAFGAQPVTLRTLDVGGDKDLPYLGLKKDDNPFLGLRAIRLCLTRPDLFVPQIKAALRASVEGNLRIMIPMISTLEEIRAARAIIQDCRDRLLEEGHKIAERIEIGIMVETPSAALLADKLSKEVDFFSIGTNDLAQYTMAADRTNSSVAALASGYQPAVLRLIAQVIASGHASGIPVALCGGLASEPAAIPILVGFGIDELSINPPDIPAAKQIIRSLVYTEVQELAKAVLEMDTSEQIIDYVNQKIESVRKVRE